MGAVVQNFDDVEQGSTFSFGFTYCKPELDEEGNVVFDTDGNPIPGDPFDLSGCSARMQVREKANSTTVMVDVTSAEDDWENGGGRITLGADGRVHVQLADTDTDKLVTKKAVYDLELVWPLELGEVRPVVERVLQGAMIIDPNVTR